MRIIVTGAGGFVGRHVLAELSEHDVVALDTDLRHIPDLRHVTKVEGDIQKLSSLVEAFKQGCDAVIHLATVPGGAAEAMQREPLNSKTRSTPNSGSTH